jgi:uncharacterized protein YecE (DUF72 family)
MTIHVGTSGWSYGHWEGVIYPTALPQRSRLGVYTNHFRTVEVNSSFYHWPRDATFVNWQPSLALPNESKSPLDLVSLWE